MIDKMSNEHNIMAMQLNICKIAHPYYELILEHIPLIHEYRYCSSNGKMLEIYNNASMVIRLLPHFKINQKFTMEQQIHVLYKLSYIGHTAACICAEFKKEWYLKVIQMHLLVHKFPISELTDISKLPKFEKVIKDENMDELFNYENEKDIIS